jgi:nucleotide-binding universal stress UspA family protein
MFKHLLITLDGSELAQKALDYVQDLAAPGARLTLLTVVDLPDISAYGLYPVPLAVDDYRSALTHAEQGALEYIEREAEPLRESGFVVDTLVLTGVAAHAIVEQAAELDVDAVVMSTHGRGGINQWLFGSVTQKVLTMTTRPVFVVPGRAMEREAKRATAEESAS